MRSPCRTHVFGVAEYSVKRIRLTGPGGAPNRRRRCPRFGLFGRWSGVGMVAGLFRRPSSPALPSLARAPAAASSEPLPAGVRGRPARGRISARAAVWRGSGALSALAARPGSRRAAAPVRSGRRRPPASAARGRRVSRSPARARAGAARVSVQRLPARGPQPARRRFYERPRRRQAEVKNRPQGLFPTRRSAFGAIRLVPLLLVHLFVVRGRESQITPDFAPAYRKRRSAP
jgi:hypothetical protein